MTRPDDHRSTESDAARNERRLRRLLDFARASGDWLWECDAELRLVWVSEGYEALTGDDARALLGRVVDDAPLLDEHGDPLPGLRLHQVLRAGAPFTRLLSEMAGARGRWIVSRSAVPVIDTDGRVAGWRGTARDVTGRVDELRRARARSAMLDKLASQLPGAIHQFLADAQGRISVPYASEGLFGLFGVTPDEVREVPGRLFARVPRADRLRMQAAMARAQAQQRPWRQEFQYRHPTQGWRWIESHSLPQRQDDGSTLWHGHSVDVTETKQALAALRRSEERWALAAEGAGIGVAQIDLGEGTLEFDAQACRNHGLAWPHGRFTLDDWVAQIAAADREDAARWFAQALRSRQAAEGRYRVVGGDGVTRWLEFVVRVHEGADGKPLAIGTCRDITAQQDAEQLRRDRDAAERASRAKSELLSRVSHELRTPLNGILGFAQLMALDTEQPLAAAQRKRLQGVERAGRHLLGLVNDVLDLSRIEQGQLELRMRSVDAVAALQSSLSMVQPLAVQHRVRLPESMPAEPCWVQADARALEQVLLNLLSNAIKYNRPDGAVTLALHAEPGRVTIAVGDQGAGLSEDEQRRLFQPFVRLGAGRGQAREGSGLGLVIARQLAEAMGGALRLRSEPGQGSCFEVVLQPSDRAGSDSGPNTLLTMPAALEPARTGSRVLYIEDEALNALLMEEVFRGHDGWRLDVARDGAEGLALARDPGVELVLIDMNLPDMSGLDVVRALRADPATARLMCVALSADATPEQTVAAREAGFDDYWTKPIDVPRMLDTIARTLESRRLH